MDSFCDESGLKGAPSQPDRWPRALGPDYAKVDDRSTDDLLDFAGRFSRLINYYGLDNKAAGTWEGFFAGDSLVAMAAIVATDLEGESRRLARLERWVRAESPRTKLAMFRALFDAALDLPRNVNRWLRALSAPNAGDASLTVRLAVESSVRDALHQSLQRLKAYDLGARRALGDRVGLDYSEFTDTWQLQDVGPDDSAYQGGSVVERIDAAVPRIRAAWQPFLDATTTWAAIVRPYLSTALAGDGAQAPHIALLVAFTELFSTAQDSVNALAGRRTDFYFRRILRERNRAAVPDTVHVAFTCAHERGAIRIPAGTLLSAGKDADGRDISFALQDEVGVTSATLSKVLTVRVASGPLTGLNDRVVTHRVVTREVGLDSVAPEGWPTFGSADDALADLGFAVSSPALELSGGHRTVTLEFQCEALTGPTAAALADVGAATGLSGERLLEALLQRAFAVSVSTAAGWVHVGSYTVRVPVDDPGPTFELRFSLSNDAPAITCLPRPDVASPGPDGGFDLRQHALASDAPAVRADLRQERVAIEGPLGTLAIHPLSVLEGLTVTRVRAHVAVVGLPGLHISNMDGEVDQSKPFPLFGSVPTVGSSVRIRHTELFSKAVTWLALHITWFDLPKSYTGFRGYFRGYGVDANGMARAGLFDNQVFRASATIERLGSGTPSAGRRGNNHFLFRTIGHAGTMPDDDDMLASSSDVLVHPLPSPSDGDTESDACIRIELTAPSHAFGHTLYQQSMLRAAVVVAPTETACDTTCRGKYDVIAETRRRLQTLLTDVERVRWVAGTLRVASPLHWVRSLAHGLRAGYLGLTRSLPASFARRQDAASGSASVIRAHYADANAAQPPALPFLDRRSSRRAVTTRLQLALRALLDEADACLSSCVSEWQDLFPRQEWRRLREQLIEAGARGADRLTAVRDLYARLDDVGTKTDGDPGRELLVRCDAILQAATWVADCASGIVNPRGWGYWKSVCANLTTCIEALQTLHESAVRQCKEACLRPRSRPLPNPPFVPQVEALTVDYAASAPATLAHLLPHDGFGHAAGEPLALLPQFAYRASVYLGFSRVVAPPTLRLHVQLGQSPRDRSSNPPVVWDALVGNQWTRLELPAGADATQGLQVSGTVSVPVPDGAAGVTTVLPSGCRWFRASVTGDPDDVPKTIGIVPHAGTAVRRLSAAAVADLGQPLPPRSISGFVKPIAGIASVIQPAASFGGRAPETDRALQTRLSERLRHKDRAILGWDYERLVLERFPDIWRAHVIPARPRRATAPEAAGPGQVRIVVVPGPRCPGVADMSAPLASPETLVAIEQSVKAATSPFVRIRALNPVYVRLRVAAVVRWRRTEDGQACADRLNAALVEHLSPWRTERVGDGWRSASEIDAFVRTHEDVESVVSIALAYEPRDAGSTEPDRRMLTSAAQHDIRAVAEPAVAAVAGY